MPFVIFDFLFFIYALIYLPYLLFTGRWYKGFFCRLGFFPPGLKNRLSKSSTIWIHAVSVGEIIAISSLITNINSRWPNYTLVVTTTTKTGYELAQNKLGQKAIVIPSPLDFSWVVSTFVRLIKPKIYIAAETEIWPNLFSCLKREKIPTVIINGRISDTSFGRYKLIKFLLKSTLDKVSLFCMQSDTDAVRIIELGAAKDKVFVVGNIKFDDGPHQETLSAILIPRNRPLWIAGSTHPGEEEIILKVFIKHKDAWDLIIAPRHVDRSEHIVRLVESQGLKAIRLSQYLGLPELNTVLIVDTIGHLKALYAKASLVFVGKSLCVGGGHNIIEPALYAKPIIVGPRMENFRDITSIFKNQGAMIQVKDTLEFEEQVDRLMDDETLRNHLGQKAYELVSANQGAGSRTLNALEKWL